MNLLGTKIRYKPTPVSPFVRVRSLYKRDGEGWCTLPQLKCFSVGKLANNGSDGSTTQWVRVRNLAQGMYNSVKGRCSLWGENQEQSTDSGELSLTREPEKNSVLTAAQRKKRITRWAQVWEDFTMKVSLARSPEPEER